MRSLGALFVACGFVVLATGPAYATTVSLSACNVAALCNQVQVNATLNGSSVDVSLSSSGNFGVFGSQGASRAFALNVGGALAGVTISNLTAGFSFGGTNIHVGGGFGTFEYIINGPQQGSKATLPFSFTVSRPGGFTSADQLFEANAAGYFFAAHVRNNGTGLTGFAGSNGPLDAPAIPEPASIALVGTGIAGLLLRARRRRK